MGVLSVYSSSPYLLIFTSIGKLSSIALTVFGDCEPISLVDWAGDYNGINSVRYVEYCQINELELLIYSGVILRAAYGILILSRDDQQLTITPLLLYNHKQVNFWRRVLTRIDLKYPRRRIIGFG
jgi:hypothetical protein